MLVLELKHICVSAHVPVKAQAQKWQQPFCTGNWTYDESDTSRQRQA
jgi:hypothetical protein